MFLGISGDKAVQQESVIDITDHRRLRPAIRAVGGDRHHAVLVEQTQYQILQPWLHWPCSLCRVQKTPMNAAPTASHRFQQSDALTSAVLTPRRPARTRR